MVNVSGVNITDYAVEKTSGHIAITKEEAKPPVMSSSLVLTRKQFDMNTGDPVSDRKVTFTEDQLTKAKTDKEAQIAALQSEITDIDLMLVDIGKL